MNDTTRFIIGFLGIVILASAVYVTLKDDVRLRVDDEKSTFYIKENNRWTVSGREYGRLFDGAKKMYRSANVAVATSPEGDTFKIVRERRYLRGPVEIETWEFNGAVDSVELFPISHKIELFNASGYLYRYEVHDLEYSGEAKSLDSDYMSFGKNMKVAWQKPYRWARAYKSGILKVQYDVSSDYEVINVRLFDPETAKITELCKVKTWKEKVQVQKICRTECKSEIENGTRCVEKEYACYQIEEAEKSECVKTGAVSAEGKIYSFEGFYCKEQGGKVCCISEMEGGRWNNIKEDGSVDGFCINPVTEEEIRYDSLKLTKRVDNAKI